MIICCVNCKKNFEQKYHERSCGCVSRTKNYKKENPFEYIIAKIKSKFQDPIYQWADEWDFRGMDKGLVTKQTMRKYYKNRAFNDRLTVIRRNAQNPIYQWWFEFISSDYFTPTVIIFQKGIFEDWT